MRLLCLVLLAGCAGSADFAGHFTGPFQVHGTCADGRTLEHAYQAEWNVTQKGDTLSIATNGSCATWTATVQGDWAEVTPKECGQSGGNGYLFWPTLAQATVSTTPEGLSAVGGFQDKATTPELDGGVTTCTTVLAADMKRTP
jgi:hypothetical protein